MPKSETIVSRAIVRLGDIWFNPLAMGFTENDEIFRHCAFLRKYIEIIKTEFHIKTKLYFFIRILY